MNTKDRIRGSLQMLRQYLEELDEIIPSSFKEYEQSLLIRRSSERQIQIIIEQVMDICAMLHHEKCFVIPGDDSGILDDLSGTWLSEEICSKIRKMKGFRNILVHGYSRLDNEVVYSNIVKGREEFRIFIDEVTECFLEPDDA